MTMPGPPGVPAGFTPPPGPGPSLLWGTRRSGDLDPPTPPGVITPLGDVLGGGRDTASVNPVTFTFGVAVDAGTLVVVDIGGAVVASLAATYTVADSKGNTYQQDIAPVLQGTSVQGTRFSCVTTSGIVAGDTLTVDPDNSVSRICVVVHAYASPAGTAWLDGTPVTSAQAATTAPSTGPTGALAQAAEVAVVAYALAANPVLTFDAGWTPVGGFRTQTGTDKQIQCAYRVLSDTAAITASATVDTSTAVVGLLSTYKANVVVGTDSRPQTGTSVAVLGPSATAAHVSTGHVASGLATLTGAATAGKASPAGGRGTVTAIGQAVARKLAPGAGLAAITAASTAAGQKAAPAATKATVAATSSGLDRKAAPGTARSVAAVTNSASAWKTSPQTGSATLAGVGRADARKNAFSVTLTALAVVAFRSSVVARAQSTLASVVALATGIARKAGPQTTAARVAAVSTAAARKSAPETSRASVAATATGQDRKVALPASRGTLASTAVSTAAKRSLPQGVSIVVFGGQASARHVAVTTGRAGLAVIGTGLPVKRSATSGTSIAVVIGSVAAARRSATAGHAWLVVTTSGHPLSHAIPGDGTTDDHPSSTVDRSAGATYGLTVVSFADHGPRSRAEVIIR